LRIRTVPLWFPCIRDIGTCPETDSKLVDYTVHTNFDIRDDRILILQGYPWVFEINRLTRGNGRQGIQLIVRCSELPEVLPAGLNFQEALRTQLLLVLRGK